MVINSPFKESMKIGILLSSCVLLLSVIPNACLVEQAIAAVAEIFPHGHHRESQHHEEANPTHSHDEEGSEHEFCCDNAIYPYLVTPTFIQLDSYGLLSSSLFFVDELEELTNTFQHNYFLHRFRGPLTIRRGDKYALSCLLHAPPYA